jgi:hypothetical protein
LRARFIALTVHLERRSVVARAVFADNMCSQQQSTRHRPFLRMGGAKGGSIISAGERSCRRRLVSSAARQGTCAAQAQRKRAALFVSVRVLAERPQRLTVRLPRAADRSR